MAAIEGDVPTVHNLDRRLAVMEERSRSDKKAVKHQFKADQTHFSKLNGEQARIAEVQNRSVTAEKFADWQESQRTAQILRDKGVDDRLKLLENRSSNLSGRFWALGIGMSIVIFIVNVFLYYITGHIK